MGDNALARAGREEAAQGPCAGWLGVKERGQVLKRQIELRKGVLHLLSVLNLL